MTSARKIVLTKFVMAAFEAGQRHGADPELVTIGLHEWAAGKKTEAWHQLHATGHVGTGGRDVRCPLCQ